MNGDFGASADSDGHSQASSPTARMYAPSKQPLKSESGKHWTKPNRGALGNSSSESGSTDDPPAQEAALSPSSVTSSGRPAQVRAVSSVISPSKPPTEVATNNNVSSLKGDRPSTLDKQISYKYIPLELASATTVKNSIAKNILYQSLGHGLMVIKYGRQGGPKQRILYCDFNVTRLYWTNSVVDADAAHASGIESQFDPSKMVNLAEVIEVRAGTDLDPETSLTALTNASKNGHQAAMILKQKKEASIKAGTEEKVHEKRKSLVGSIFGSHAHDKEDELLYGTATLRKKAKPEEFSRCLSLITQDRSVDIQCFSKKDYNLLYINLKEIVNKLRNPTTVPATLAPAVSEYRETLSTKKSVRFASPEDAMEGKEDQSPARPNRLAAVNSFASTMTDSSQPDVVYELNDDNSIDKLLSSPGSGSAAAKAPSSATAVGTRRRAESDGSDSGHNPHTFSDDQQRADRELVRTLSGISGLSLDMSTVHGRSYSNDEKESNSAKSPYRMKAHEALQIGLILSQQEQQFGTNMYQALRPEDEPEIEHLNSMGYSTEEAILKIFQKRFQPDLHEEGEDNAPVSLESNSARFEYDDQFNESGDTFSGSVKSMFGRQSSFFPQVFHDGTETEVSVTERTSGAGGRKDRAPPSATPEDSDDSVKVSPKAGRAEAKAASKQMFTSPMTQRQKDMMQPEPNSSPSKKQNPILRLSSNDALQIGLLLSQQEEEHGVNMYDSLEVSDESTIRKLCQQGYSNDEAVLEIFNRKFGKTGPQTKWSGVSAAQPVSSRLPSPPAQQSSFSPPPLPSGYLGQRSTSELSPPAYQQQTATSFASGGSQRSSFTPELSPPPPYQTPSQPQPPAYQTPPQPTPPAYQTPPPPNQLPGAYPSGGTQRSSAYSESPAQNSYGSPAYQSNPPPAYQQEEYNAQYRPPPINTQPPPRQALQRSNSLAQSSFFPNDPNVMRPQYAMNPNGNGPPQQQSQRQLNRQSSMLSPRTVSRSNMLTTLTDDEAVNMALMLSQQETDHGINMYDSLRASDEQELQNLIASGYTNEQAVLFIFEKRYPPKNQHRPQPFANQQNPAVTRQSMYNMPVPQQQPVWEDPNMGYQMQSPPYQMQQPLQHPGYGPPPQRSMARPQSMYAPPPEVRPSVIQQQHQLQSMYSSQYGGMSEPSPVPLGGHDPRMMRPPAVPTPPVVHQPLQRQQSILIPVREQPASSPPVVSVVSAVPISDADDRMAAPQATHVGYTQGNVGYSQGSPGYVQGNVASAVPAPQWSPPPAYSRPAPGPSPQNYQQSYQGSSHNSSNNSMGSGGTSNNNNNGGQGDRKLVKKRSIFNFVTSGNGGEHTGGAGRQRYKDADVHAITKMGYSKDQAVWALLQSNNNLPMAIEALCNS